MRPCVGCAGPFMGLGSATMNETLYEFVMRQLQASKGRWPAVAQSSGVSLRTIRKIASKEIQDPGVSHVEKLAEHFRETLAA